MSHEIMAIRNVKQAVENSRIPEIYFRGFYLPFTDIFMPWLELANHKGTRQDIKIGPDCLTG